jgi:hypothetical protein
LQLQEGDLWATKISLEFPKLIGASIALLRTSDPETEIRVVYTRLLRLTESRSEVMRHRKQQLEWKNDVPFASFTILSLGDQGIGKTRQALSPLYIPS